MKKLLFIMAVLCTVAVLAEESVEVPRKFKDSAIERKLSDGTVQKFDGDEYEIVKRHKPRKPALPKPVPTPVVREVVREVEVVRTVEKSVTLPPKRNRLCLLAGSAPQNDLISTRNVGYTTVENNVDFTGGLQYQRLLNDRWSLGVQVQTNESAFLGLGYDF